MRCLGAVYSLGLLEFFGVQEFVGYNSVCCLELEFYVSLSLHHNLEQCAAAVYFGLLAQVYECGVEGCGAVGVQAVLSLSESVFFSIGIMRIS